MFERIYRTPCFSVTTEPGDMTRYSLFVHPVGPDEFTFAPNLSTFRVPQRLNYWDVKDAGDEKIKEIAEKENCNYWTVKECIRIIKKLHDEE